MMTNAYDKSYLEDAMHNLGAMADCAVNVLGVPESELWSRFLASGVAARFGNGAPDIVAGHSGPELAHIVLRETGKDIATADGTVSVSSPQYWAGWVLAYYQWMKGLSFRELSRAGIDLRTVTGMFNPLHEADVSFFSDIADRLLESRGENNWLREARRLNGLTQKELSEKSGVPIRLIRAYEQGTIDMGRAEYRTIGRLARGLHKPLRYSPG